MRKSEIWVDLHGNTKLVIWYSKRPIVFVRFAYDEFGNTTMIAIDRTKNAATRQFKKWGWERV